MCLGHVTNDRLSSGTSCRADHLTSRGRRVLYLSQALSSLVGNEVLVNYSEQDKAWKTTPTPKTGLGTWPRTLPIIAGWRILLARRRRRDTQLLAVLRPLKPKADNLAIICSSSSVTVLL